MRSCTCDNCGMEFTVQKLDTEKDTIRGDHAVEVISFTCPKCDEKFIVAVRDAESRKLRDQLQEAQKKYQGSYDPNNPDKMRQAQKQVSFYKRKLMNYMSKLKKQYLKELRRRGD